MGAEIIATDNVVDQDLRTNNVTIVRSDRREPIATLCF